MSTYGFGVSPFGTGPGGLFYVEAQSDTRGQVTASRKVDANGNFVQLEDGTGAFAGTSDTMHRATMLLGRFRPKGNVSARQRLEDESEIRRLLRPLTTGREPVARVLEILYVDGGKSTVGYAVRFLDLTDNQVKVLQAT
jgi:hypothetical protein